MTIKWGDPIECNGVRPEWLRDREDAEIENSPGEWLNWAGCSWHGRVSAVRLPADHFAYTAIRAGFTPWAGGDSAPDDWDATQPVLFRDLGQSINSNWRWRYGSGNPLSDIIGYRKRTEFGKVHADGSRSGGQPPHYAPCDFSEEDLRRVMNEGPRLARVEREDGFVIEGMFIPRMTDAEARERARSNGYADATPEIEHYVGALHDIGLIRPETPEERFTRETGHEVTDAVRAALNWKDTQA